MKNNILSPTIWDLFCALSLVGIWPRFIEPAQLCTTQLRLRITGLPPALTGFKILQISDLHINPSLPRRLLNKLAAKVKLLKPDLLLFTGDFLSYGQLQQPAQLKELLNQLHAPYGCFAILGNHDYAECVSINPAGTYDLIQPGESPLQKAFGLLFKRRARVTGQISARARAVPFNQPLLDLLTGTPFQLLHNETAVIRVKDAKLNLCGLGEYMLGRALPEQAFAHYDRRYPGIILLHNPDAARLLQGYPGDVILSGHTHGGQINLPWIWKKFTLLENMKLKKGLHQLDDKWLYINRGLGSTLPFRCFSPPEMLLLTLER